MEKAKLSDIAKHTLKQICSQEWVHNRCLQVSLFLLSLIQFLTEIQNESFKIGNIFSVKTRYA